MSEKIMTLSRRKGVHPLIKIDGRGDLTFLVSKGECKNKKKGFLVCSRAVDRSSKPLETMLYGPFLEAKPSDHSSAWIVRIPKDDSDAFQVILNIVHCNWEQIPESVDREFLYKVVVLADKYIMAHSLGSIARAWYKRIMEQSDLFGREGGIISISGGIQALREVMRIGRWMEDDSVVWRGLIYYAWHSSVEDGELVYGSDKHGFTEPGAKTTTRLVDDMQGWPEVYLDAVRSLRANFIRDITAQLAGMLRRASFTQICQVGNVDCSKAIVEKMKRDFSAEGIWPLPKVGG